MKSLSIQIIKAIVTVVICPPLKNELVRPYFYKHPHMLVTVHKESKLGMG